jgi:putative (di)nucleoside polyphosphate hydrolase
MALTELARFLPRSAQHNRYLRSGMRPHHRDEEIARRTTAEPAADAAVVLPLPPTEPRL